MANTATGTTERPDAAAGAKTCFVVSEFGSDEATRTARLQTLKHLVRKVLVPMGYRVDRADDIDDVGQITHQIIERLLDDDLVVADLTGLNPNVFYELAVRHAARKPVITLMTFGNTIPFDLKDVRTVFYDLRDPDKLEAAQDDLRMKVEAIEKGGPIRNPITVARDVTLFQRSDDPEVQAQGALLEAMGDLRNEVRALARIADQHESPKAQRWLEQQILDEVKKRDLSPEELVAMGLGSSSAIASALKRLETRAELFPLASGKWSEVPF